MLVWFLITITLGGTVSTTMAATPENVAANMTEHLRRQILRSFLSQNDVAGETPFDPRALSDPTGRALWGPVKMFLPFLTRFFSALLNPVARSRGILPNSRMDEVPGEENKEETKVSFVLPKILRSLGLVPKKDHHSLELCREMGGVMISGECQEYFGEGERRPFESARAFCKARGGDLWTPDLRDPFLYQKLMKFIPQIAGAHGEDLWMGVYLYNDRVYTIKGEDVTDAFIVQIYDRPFTEGRCFILDYPNGDFVARDADCHSPQEFVCEYPLTSLNEIVRRRRRSW